MKNLVIGTISGIIGVLTGMVIKEMMNKNLDETKKVIDNTLDTEVEQLFEKIGDPVQKRGFIQQFHNIIKEGYHAKTTAEVLAAHGELQMLLKDIGDLVDMTDDDDADSDLSDDDKALLETYLRSLGLQLEEALKLNKGVVEPAVNENLIHPVKITPDDAERYKEEDNNDGDDSSETSIESVPEPELNEEQEIAAGEELSKEEQSPVEPSETVQVEDVPVTTEMDEYVDHVDDNKFSTLLKYFVRPLLDRYGDDYEDRLLRMIEILSDVGMDTVTYDEYTTKLKAVVNYHQNNEKGKRKLNNIISSFFSMYPSGSDEE